MIIVNVTDWGAVGDGVTDNTKAFREAQDFAQRVGADEVVIPPGTYLLCDVVRGRVRMRGLGRVMVRRALQ